MRVTSVLLCCCFSAHEEFKISCSCPYTRVSLGCQSVFILISSSRRRCKLPFLCPLVDLFLREVGKLKNLQDEVLYVLVIHLEASIISVMVTTRRSASHDDRRSPTNSNPPPPNPPSIEQALMMQTQLIQTFS